MENFDLASYLTGGVERIVKSIVGSTLSNLKASVFMAQYALSARKAADKRAKVQDAGNPVPPFLIASITTQCNLHCKGCYARANHNCTDDDSKTGQMLTAEEWGRIFDEASDMGVSFILLAGGEPMTRKDVLLEAGQQKDILFPIFTNGTMFTDKNVELIAKHPNLLPVLSIEGKMETTDDRRGEGVYNSLLIGMERLKAKSITFGASVTIHKENMEEVMSAEFLNSLRDKGCKAVVYVEYVPMDESTAKIAIDDDDRDVMNERLLTLRNSYEDMLFVSFPGDEKTSGGCLAAGRGFFHINAYGGAEPCPFSAYSDTSLRDVSLKEAMNSPLFRYLKESGTLANDHTGGCVLFENESVVQSFMANKG